MRQLPTRFPAAQAGGPWPRHVQPAGSRSGLGAPGWLRAVGLWPPWGSGFFLFTCHLARTQRHCTGEETGVQGHDEGLRGQAVLKHPSTGSPPSTRCGVGINPFTYPHPTPPQQFSAVRVENRNWQQPSAPLLPTCCPPCPEGLGGAWGWAEVWGWGEQSQDGKCELGSAALPPKHKPPGCTAWSPPRPTPSPRTQE